METSIMAETDLEKRISKLSPFHILWDEGQGKYDIHLSPSQRRRRGGFLRQDRENWEDFCIEGEHEKMNKIDRERV
jgi:hypothetical protein